MRNYLHLMVVVPAVGAAQPLDTFLRSSMERNVDARLAQEATRRAEAELGQAWGRLLPALSATGGWTRNQFDAVVEFPSGTTPTGQVQTTTVTIVPRDQLDATLRAELPLIVPSQWVLTSAAAAGAEAARNRETGTRAQVSRQVVQAYYRHLAARSVLASARRSVDVAVAQQEQIGKRVQAGVASELDQARAEAEVERTRQVLADADVVAETSARALATLSGLAPVEEQALPEDDLHAEPPLADFEGRSGTTSTVRAATGDRDQAARTYAAATLTLVPTVNAQFTQRFTNATGFQDAAALYNFGVNFSWRLDVPAVYALSSQASALSSADLSLDRARQDALDRIHADWHQVRAAITKVKSATAQLAAATRAAALARERFEAGVATQVDVTQADRDQFSAEVSRIQALADLKFARAALRLSAELEVNEEVNP